MRWADYFMVFICIIFTVLRSAFGETQGSLIIKSRSSVFNAGEKKAIFCEGNGVTEPIEWYTPSGEKVPHGSSSLNKRIYSEPKNVGDKILVPLFIHSTKLEDSGNWTCRAGDLSETIEFNVGVKVVIPMRTQTVIVDEGNKATLYCEAKGYPEPSVQWYFDNVPIQDESNKYSIVRKEDNYTLLIKNVQHNDAGDYVCKVTQKVLSHYTDKTINLVVHHKPFIFNPEKNEVYQPISGKRLEVVEEVFAVVGDTKPITCNAIAMPPPTFHWYKMIDGYQSDIKQIDLIETSDDKLSSTFTLRMNSESDAGTYRCIAKNKKGQAIVDFDVTPGRKPDPPSEISVADFNTTHITFNVTCENCTLIAKDDATKMDPSNLPVDGYSFHLVTHSEEFQEPDWLQDGNVTDFDIENVNVTLFPFGPLPNGTTFHVRVRSRNAAGYSEWLEMPGTCQTKGAARLAATSVFIIALLFFLN